MSRPLTVGTVNGLVAVVLWAAWLFLAYLALALLARAVLKLRLPVPRLVLRWQGLVAMGTGAVVVAVPSAVHAASAPAAAVAPGSHVVAGTPTGTPTALPTYLVRRDDSLSKIARRTLGDPDRWPEIYRLNRGRHWPEVGGTLTDPNVIFPGWRLRLPADAHVPTTQRSPGGDPAGHHPTPPPHSSGATVAPHTQGPTAGDSERAPQPSASTAGSPGVQLPDGWLGIGLSAAIATAAGLVLLRRRRRYVPAPLAVPAIDDPGLRPLPPAAVLIRRAVRVHASAAPDPHDSPPTPPAAAAPLADPVGPLGQAGFADRPGRLALVGPGAHAAARGLIVAYLTGDGHPRTGGEVVLTADAYAALLADAGQEALGTDGLAVVAGIAEALTLVEEAVIHRRRTSDDTNTPDGAEERPMLLLATAPPAAVLGRLATTSQLAAAIGIDTVIVGEWPGTDAVEVTADGHCTIGERAAVLDVRATVEVLQVVGESRTDRPAALADLVSATSTAPLVELDSRADRPAAQGDSGAPPSAAAPTAAEPPPVSGRGSKVQLVALGKPAVFDRHGAPVTSLRTNAGHIMVYLAAYHRPVTEGDIMAAMWPDAQLKPARDRLFAEISDLRRCIRQAAGTTDIQPVPRRGQTYHLDDTVVDVDIWRIARRLHDAAMATDRDTRIAALADAVDIHRGVLAEDDDWDGVETVRELIRRQGLHARTQLAELLADTDPDRAAALIDEAIAADPYNEAVAQCGMRIAAATHRPAAVTAHLQRLRLALDEIDAVPSAETVALARHLLTMPVAQQP